MPDDMDKAIENVVLTDAEAHAAIRSAKIQKYWDNREQSIKQMQEAMVAEVNRKWSWRDQLDYLWVRCDELKIPATVLSNILQANEFVVHTMCKYFTNDTAFEKCGEGFSLQKGLYIHGYVGNGKTTLVRLFARNKKQSYIIHRALDIQSLFVQNGKDGQMVIDNMCANEGQARDIRLFFQRVTGRCFDDFGTEEHPFNHYGTKRYIMGEILMGRYDIRGETVPLSSTHVTSNLNPFELMADKTTRIEQEYGTRLYDRFRDMFNVIELKGGSLRG